MNADVSKHSSALNGVDLRPNKTAMNFRLTTLLWAFAVVGASLAMLGGWGLLAAVGVLLLWNAVFDPIPKIVNSLVVFGVLFVIVAMLIPPVETARQAAQSSSCLGHLCQLQLAIENYHSANGFIPPVTFSVEGSDHFHS